MLIIQFITYTNYGTKYSFLCELHIILVTTLYKRLLFNNNFLNNVIHLNPLLFQNVIEIKKSTK